GLNALAHCVDALWAPRANPISTVTAVEGMRLMAAGLSGVHADRAEREARERCMLGAYLCGRSFATAGSGLHHKICHVLAVASDLPHSSTYAALLPYVVAYNAPAAPEAAARIATALDSPDALSGVLALVRTLRAPTSLGDLGLPGHALDRAARLVPDA